MGTENCQGKVGSLACKSSAPLLPFGRVVVEGKDLVVAF